MPFIIGVVSLIICLLYNHMFLKCIFIMLYIVSIVISLVSIMGMTSIWELGIFIPHIAIFILHYLVLKRKNKMLGRN